VEPNKLMFDPSTHFMTNFLCTVKITEIIINNGGYYEKYEKYNLRFSSLLAPA
jgi:hypothetical protein